MTTNNTPLNDAELAELDEYLFGEDDERLAIDEAHGYFTALIVSHSELDDEAVLAAVLGRAGAPARIHELLLRMYAEIATGLKAGTPFEPMVIEEEENGESFEVYEGWCYGFMLAVSDHEEVWQALPKEMRDLLEPIATLSLLREEEFDMDDEEYAGWVGLLPGSVSGLYAGWR
jgi:uncharacterized protein